MAEQPVIESVSEKEDVWPGLSPRKTLEEERRARAIIGSIVEGLASKAEFLRIPEFGLCLHLAPLAP